MTYKIIEISPQMCEKALNKLSASHQKHVEKKAIQIINQDFLLYDNQNDSNELQFLIFLEVLDNMPHDRVYLNPKTKKFD